MSESERTRPDVQRQMVFAEGGEIEPEEGPVGTSLEELRGRRRSQRANDQDRPAERIRVRCR